MNFLQILDVEGLTTVHHDFFKQRACLEWLEKEKFVKSIGTRCTVVQIACTLITAARKPRNSRASMELLTEKWNKMHKEITHFNLVVSSRS